MGKRLLRLTVICMFAFLFIFSSTAMSEDFKWPEMLTIGTASTQSSNFASTNGWSAILGEDKNLKVRVIPEDSEFRRYSRLALQKDFQVAAISFSDASGSMEGIDGYKVLRAAPTRVVWQLIDTPWSFAVRGDSPYKTIYDLKQKGVRVALNRASPGMSLTSLYALPAFLGWTREEAEKNWTYVPVGSYAANCKSITEGKADVAWICPVSSITYEMESHPKGLRWLSTPSDDKEGWDGILKFRPTTMPMILDFGVKSAIGVAGQTSPFMYYTTPDVDQEMIYNLAKWINESFDSYKDSHAIAPRMALKKFRDSLNHCPHPVAEGTIRYLREIGQWTEEDDKWNAEAIKLMDRWVNARNEAIDEAESKGVKLDYQNEEFVNILKKHTEGIPVFRVRM